MQLIAQYYGFPEVMKLRTAADVKLERLKFAILFTIVDMCSVKTKINARYQKIQKLGTKVSFTLHSPIFFHSHL